MLKIFISYRREDSAGYVLGLTDRIAQRFGEEHVFMDIDSVQPGEDFGEVIRSQVGTCDVQLVVIGPRWMEATDDTGRRRIEDPADFVRLEVETALERQIPVIPVLVGGASPLKAHELPESLKPLVRRQAIELSNTRFRPDVERLIHVLDRFTERLARTKERPVEFRTPEPDATERVATTPSSSSWLSSLSPPLRTRLLIVALVLAVAATAYTLSRPSRPAPELTPSPRSEAPSPRPSLSTPPPPRVRSELEGFRIRVRSKTHDISMRRYCDLLEDAGLKVRCEVTNQGLSRQVMDDKIFLNCARLPDNTPEIVSRIVGRKLSRIVDWRRDAEVGANPKQDFCTAGYNAIELYLL